MKTKQEMRDRISEMLSHHGCPNGENDIDEIEALVWDDISDDELQATIETTIL